VVDFRKFLFLFRDFLVRMWLAKALFLTSFPVAVLLNRFNAPLFVFILGMKNLAPQLENWNSGVTEKPFHFSGLSKFQTVTLFWHNEH